jgi:enoyl-CoA hydratase/carnithine racemase
VGAGVDIISACDVRVGTHTARFCVKEVDLGITADLGTLQRLPHIVGEARTRELALTARTFSGDDALAYGLVTSCHDSPAAALHAAMDTARLIAAKPGLAVSGTKKVLLATRDTRVSEGLEYVAMWNSALLLSTGLEEALAASARPRTNQLQLAAQSRL